MANRPHKIPSYRVHKPTGQAVVRLNGRDHYLGKHGTEASHEAYDRLIAEWLATGQHRTPEVASRPGRPGPTVSELILAFHHHAERHYRGPDGRPTRELDNLRAALRPVRRLYGALPARDFSPLKLRGVQEEMVRSGLCRAVVNDRVKRVRRAFKWAASVELIPASVVGALATVPPLLRGRCDAPESPGVKPVDWAHVEATLPHLPRQVRAMVNLMRFSNCRAEDVVALRGSDLTMHGEVWTFRPAAHKNAWRGHDRVIYLGQQAQEVIRPFLRTDLQAYLFCPREALDEHHARRREGRRTRRTPSELGRTRRPAPGWTPGSRYTVNTFQQAVRRSCRRANVPSWSVLQVRHTRATEVRERYGVEGAAASLGHRRVETSQIYAQKNEELAKRIARDIG
jgi:integrase